MSSQGPLNPATLANDASFGSSAWINPAAAAASDDSKASGPVVSASTTQYLKATNFGFSIPAGAIIDGIVVEIERSETIATDDVFDSRVRIVKSGTVGATDKASGTEWPTTDAYATYGSSSDLWGETWTDTNINASDFGVVIAARTTASSGTALIDHIRITVYYSGNITSETLLPNGTTSAGSWKDQAGGTNLHLAVDEGVDTNDGDTTYIQDSAPNGSTFKMAFTNPLLAGPFGQITLRLRHKWPFGSGASLLVSAYVNGSQLPNSFTLTPSTSYSTATASWSGSWTQADLNTLELWGTSVGTPSFDDTYRATAMEFLLDAIGSIFLPARNAVIQTEDPRPYFE